MIFIQERGSVWVAHLVSAWLSAANELSPRWNCETIPQACARILNFKRFAFALDMFLLRPRFLRSKVIDGWSCIAFSDSKRHEEHAAGFIKSWGGSMSHQLYSCYYIALHFMSSMASLHTRLELIGFYSDGRWVD